jgi:4-alpha-glucanotransferase
MRILQFGFADRGGHLYLPHRCVPNTVIYTGTHDNNTTLGWWQDDATPLERENVQVYLQQIDHPNEIVWAMIKAAARSVADTCIFPLQDVLHLGTDARMNVPSGVTGNWTWRYAADALHPDYARQLASLMEMTDRDGYELPVEGSDAGKPTADASRRADLGTTV